MIKEMDIRKLVKYLIVKNILCEIGYHTIIANTKSRKFILLLISLSRRIIKERNSISHFIINILESRNRSHSEKPVAFYVGVWDVWDVWDVCVREWRGECLGTC